MYLYNFKYLSCFCNRMFTSLYLESHWLRLKSLSYSKLIFWGQTLKSTYVSLSTWSSCKWQNRTECEYCLTDHGASSLSNIKCCLLVTWMSCKMLNSETIPIHEFRMPSGFPFGCSISHSILSRMHQEYVHLTYILKGTPHLNLLELYIIALILDI